MEFAKQKVSTARKTDHHHSVENSKNGEKEYDVEPEPKYDKHFFIEYIQW